MRPMALQRGARAARQASLALAWLLAGAAPATIARADAPGQTAPVSGSRDAFDTIYERGKPLEASLETIRARFTETTTSSLLVQPLVAEGTLIVRRPHDVVLRYSKPETKVLRLDATSLVFVWPERQIRERKDIADAQARVQRYFVGKNPDELRRHFTIVTSEDAAAPGTWRIDMRPKRAQIKQGLERLELWVRHDTLMLSSMRMTFPGGDTKTMTFADVVVNAPVADADFATR